MSESPTLQILALREIVFEAHRDCRAKPHPNLPPCSTQDHVTHVDKVLFHWACVTCRTHAAKYDRGVLWLDEYGTAFVDEELTVLAHPDAKREKRFFDAMDRAVTREGNHEEGCPREDLEEARP